MTGAEILKATFLDLLFENRNKLYGAYVLRKYYNRRLVTALGISLSAVLLLVLLFLQNRTTVPNVPLNNSLAEEVIVRMQTIPDEPETPEPPQPPVQKPAPAVAQQPFTRLHITPDPVDITEVPTQEDLKNASVSSKTNGGTLSETVPALTEAGTGKEPAPEAQTTAPSYTEPQFPGGAAAWTAFLSRHLQAPESLEAGEKRTVLVRFLVSPEGAVTAFEIVQSAGKAFDAEVIRVLKKMPKWKPAVRNGQSVGVPFTQPVTFIGMDE